MAQPPPKPNDKMDEPGSDNTASKKGKSKGGPIKDDDPPTSEPGGDGNGPIFKIEPKE